MYAQTHYMTVSLGISWGYNTEDSQRFNFHRWRILPKRSKQWNYKQLLKMVYIWIFF